MKTVILWLNTLKDFQKKLTNNNIKNSSSTIPVVEINEKRESDNFQSNSEQKNKNIKIKSKGIEKEKMLLYYNSDILISDIAKPFSILLKQIELLHSNFSINPSEKNVNLQIKVMYNYN